MQPTGLHETRPFEFSDKTSSTTQGTQIGAGNCFFGWWWVQILTNFKNTSTYKHKSRSALLTSDRQKKCWTGWLSPYLVIEFGWLSSCWVIEFLECGINFSVKVPIPKPAQVQFFVRCEWFYLQECKRTLVVDPHYFGEFGCMLVVGCFGSRVASTNHRGRMCSH